MAGNFGFAVRVANLFRGNTVEAHTAVKADTISELSSGSGVTIDGVLIKDSQLQATAPIKADTIAEYTSAAGVTTDGVKLKDGEVTHAVAGNLNGAPLPDGVKPSSWITYFEDFIRGGVVADDELANESTPAGAMFSETADGAQYLVTLATTGEAATPKLATGAAAGGWLDVLTTATQNHPVNCQMNGTPWVLADGKKFYFETKIMVEDVDQCDWFIGLSIANTDILASGVGTVDDIIGFCGLHTTAIQFISNEDGTDSIDATAGTIADGSIATISTKAKTLAFYFDGDDTVTYYVDGTAAGTMSVTDDDLNQDEGMSVAFVCDNSQGGTAERMWIDYIYVAQER